jgi:hypothetical protein
MELVQFLKPDLRRVLLLQIILSPLIAFFVPEFLPELILLIFIVGIPFAFLVILFGQSMWYNYHLFSFLFVSMFWYVFSCSVVTMWDSKRD